MSTSVINPLKRTIDTTEDPIPLPMGKRHDVTTKSLKTTIQDASTALVEQITKAEEQLRALRREVANLKAVKEQMRVQGPEPSNMPPKRLFIVKETFYIDKTDEGPLTMVGCFATLEDANNRSRNHCADFAFRDDPKFDHYEEYTSEGTIYWENRNENGEGYKVEIEEADFVPAGEEPVKDWGRDIGVECPSASEEEEESDSEDSVKGRYY